MYQRCGKCSLKDAFNWIKLKVNQSAGQRCTLFTWFVFLCRSSRLQMEGLRCPHHHYGGHRCWLPSTLQSKSHPCSLALLTISPYWLCFSGFKFCNTLRSASLDLLAQRLPDITFRLVCLATASALWLMLFCIRRCLCSTQHRFTLVVKPAPFHVREWAHLNSFSTSPSLLLLETYAWIFLSFKRI